MTIPTLLGKYLPTGLLGIGSLRSWPRSCPAWPQCDRLQHGVDLRHLPELPRAQPAATPTTSGWAHGDRVRHPRQRRPPLIWPSKFNKHHGHAPTVFGFVNAPLFPRSSWACSGAARRPRRVLRAAGGTLAAMLSTAWPTPGRARGNQRLLDRPQFEFASEIARTSGWHRRLHRLLRAHPSSSPWPPADPTQDELKGLVYSSPPDQIRSRTLYQRPVTVGVIVMLAAILLNLISGNHPNPALRHEF